MKKYLEVFLSILTAMGGFVEIGELVFTVNAGAKFGYSLLWVVLLGTVGIIVYGEMAGRIAAVNQDPVFYLIRERNGYALGLGTLIAANIVCLLTCAAEIGGLALVLKLLVGGPYRLLVLGALLFLLLAVWFLSFQAIERVFGLLGLLMLVFVFSAIYLHPDWTQVGRSLLPNLPHVESPRDYLVYAYFCVALMSSIMLPYETYFYSSGAIEEKWTEPDLWINRTTSYLGMGFGSIVSMGVLVTSAVVLGPLQIRVDSYEQAALMFVPAFGRWAVTLFACALGVGCFGAAIEITLNAGYVLSQSFGWPWGIDKARRDATRFCTAFTVVLLLSVLIAVVGFDPLQMTLISVALTVVIMPLVVLPFLVLMNDHQYVKQHKAGPLANGFLAALTIVGALMALVVIPLEIFGG